MWRSDLPVMEYFGKNIGVRRAFGKFVILGGSDSLPHEGIFRTMKEMENDAGLLRCDVKSDRQSRFIVDIRDCQACPRCIGAYRQMTQDDDLTGYSRDEYIKWRDKIARWISTGPQPSIYSPSIKPIPPLLQKEHWNATGDFTLCTKRAFHRIGGYLEGPYRTHVDSLLIRQAEKCGVTLRVFHPSLSVFHQV